MAELALIRVNAPKDSPALNVRFPINAFHSTVWTVAIVGLIMSVFLIVFVLMDITALIVKNVKKKLKYLKLID